MKKKKVVQEDFPLEPDDLYDDFDVLRCIVNLTRRYPRSKAKFIREELGKMLPGICGPQIARCCKMITDRWNENENPVVKRAIRSKS